MATPTDDDLGEQLELWPVVRGPDGSPWPGCDVCGKVNVPPVIHCCCSRCGHPIKEHSNDLHCRTCEGKPWCAFNAEIALRGILARRRERDAKLKRRPVKDRPPL